MTVLNTAAHIAFEHASALEKGELGHSAVEKSPVELPKLEEDGFQSSNTESESKKESPASDTAKWTWRHVFTIGLAGSVAARQAFRSLGYSAGHIPFMDAAFDKAGSTVVGFTQYGSQPEKYALSTYCQPGKLPIQGSQHFIPLNCGGIFGKKADSRISQIVANKTYNSFRSSCNEMREALEDLKISMTKEQAQKFEAGNFSAIRKGLSVIHPDKKLGDLNANPEFIRTKAACDDFQNSVGPKPNIIENTWGREIMASLLAWERRQGFKSDNQKL